MIDPITPPKMDPSTLVQKGQEAVTFPEVESFVKDVETRPMDRLLSDLPSLLEMGDAKFHLVALALKRRFRANEIERAEILAKLERIGAASSDPAIQHRCSSFKASKPRA